MRALIGLSISILILSSCKQVERAKPDARASRATPAAGSRASVDEPAKAFSAVSEVVPEGKDSFSGLGSAALRKVVERALGPQQQESQAPPLSLTASDGSGLELVSMAARAVIEGPLAFTELHLTFRNPEDRQIEGRFAITLPQKAAISRLAMKLPGGWQEAEVVERQAARRAYEDVLHRRQDPALLEKKAGNEFRARIFPIPPRGLKEIKLSYSQQLDLSSKPYRLPLRGLPRMEHLSITAFLSRTEAQQASTSLGGTALSQQVIKVDKEGYKPDRDFEVKPEAGVAALRHDNLVVARFKPEISSTRASMKGLLVLVDTSASRAVGFESQLRGLGELLQKLSWSYGNDLPLQVTCFDQGLSTVYTGALGRFTRDHLEAILARRALGASDLHGALAWAWTAEGYDRLLLVTDGVATAGEIRADALRKKVKGLGKRIKRVDALLVGGIRDEALMGKLVRGTLAQDGAVLDGDEPAETLARRLSQTTVSGVEVDVPGARWVWPSRLDGLQPDDEVLVFADLPPQKPVAIRVSGPIKQAVKVAPARVNRPLLERAWIRASIERLEHERDTLTPERLSRKADIDKEIVKLSTEHRVLCDQTALLVLESEADYERHGINRRALADILTVGATGIELLKRKAPIYQQAPPPVVRASTGRDGRRHRGGGEGLANLGSVGGAAPGGAVPGPAVANPAPAARPDRDDDEPDRLAKREEAPEAKALAEDRPAPARVASPRPEPAARPRPRRMRRRVPPASPSEMRPPPPPSGERSRGDNPQVEPYSGRFAQVMQLIERKRLEQALAESLRWHDESPGDVLALVALGESLVRLQRPLLAARVYGSIIDLFPSRADMRRFAAQRLESLGEAGQDLAADAYAEAVRQRPDHPNSHRMLAYALLRLGRHAEAFAAMERGLERSYPEGRFAGVERIMREDLGLIAAAWIRKEPKQRAALRRRLTAARSELPRGPSLRFLLSWETDANDVDFHIHDGRGGHAFYSQKDLPSGGSLYADVTTGYGPECFTIDGKATAFPYRLKIHYYSRGPMGFGMGRLQIVQHDGEGGLKLEQRPFVVMNDRAFVDLGTVKDYL